MSDDEHGLDEMRPPENSPTVKAKLVKLQRLVEKVHRREMLHLDLIEAVYNWHLAAWGGIDADAILADHRPEDGPLWKLEPDLKLIEALATYNRAADEEEEDDGEPVRGHA